MDKQRQSRKESTYKWRLKQKLKKTRSTDHYRFPVGGSDPFDHYRENSTWITLKTDPDINYLQRHEAMRDLEPTLYSKFHEALQINLTLIKERYLQELGLIPIN